MLRQPYLIKHITMNALEGNLPSPKSKTMNINRVHLFCFLKKLTATVDRCWYDSFLIGHLPPYDAILHVCHKSCADIMHVQCDLHTCQSTVGAQEALNTLHTSQWIVQYGLGHFNHSRRWSIEVEVNNICAFVCYPPCSDPLQYNVSSAAACLLLQSTLLKPANRG